MGVTGNTPLSGAVTQRGIAANHPGTEVGQNGVCLVNLDVLTGSEEGSGLVDFSLGIGEQLCSFSSLPTGMGREEEKEEEAEEDGFSDVGTGYNAVGDLDHGASEPEVNGPNDLLHNAMSSQEMATMTSLHSQTAMTPHCGE